MRTKRSLIRAGMLLCLLLAPQAVFARTFYVDALKGNNLVSTTQAQNAATPWKTIKRAVGVAIGGDTVMVMPGTYMESVESKRDGTAIALITLRSATSGAATIQPPAGSNGFFISHNYHAIDGFTVTAGVTGIKAGPHDAGNGPVVGLLVENNQVVGNINNGIQFNNGLNGEIAFNTVYQNVLNGIEHEGNASLIHDNVVHHNGQFGVYVRDGVDHQVFNNQSHDNTGGDLQINGSLLATQRTLYIDSASGNDAYTAEQAQNPATPWKTIKTAVAVVNAGDTVIVLPGVYPESVESKRDGSAAKPITIRAATAGTAAIQPPGGTSGFVITHNYHVVDGFVVSGGVNGVQAGPHDAGGGPLTGPVVTNNQITGGTGVGIKFSNAVGGAAMHNVISNTGKDGILYSGSAANVSNNLVYSAGLGGSGIYGITLSSGSGHQIINNTVSGNASGGIRLGDTNTSPVFSTVLNNIVVGNPVGIKEPVSASYTGKATLDYNDVFGNTSKNYDLSATTGSTIGTHSISLNPGFVPGAVDFRLGRVATGQPANSPCIDAGSNLATAVGLGGRTAFTDKSPDTGPVDLGYHGPSSIQVRGVCSSAGPQ